MPSQSPLPFVADLPGLEAALNFHELKLGHQVISIFAKAGDALTDRFNLVSYEFKIAARDLRRLHVIQVPAGATADDEDKATNPEQTQDVRNAFQTFVAPLLNQAEVLCRAEVFVNNSKVEIVVLREADAIVPVELNGVELQSGQGWDWTAEVIGPDIVVQGAKASAFGGDSDKSDNGQTACGFPTKGHPDLMGCALPLGGYAHTAREHDALDGTPLPHLEFGLTSKGADRPNGAHVEVNDPTSGARAIIPVIDLGPGRRTGHALDLTVAAARIFKSSATANNFSVVLNYRLINGALALPPDLIPVKKALPAAAGDPATINAKIYASALKNNGVLDSSKIPYTEHGVLGCAWSINEIVRQALGHPIGGDLSTASVYEALKGGRGAMTDENHATAGTIIVSPTQGDVHGHIGIVGENRRIYSNQSKDGIFAQNYDFSTWKLRYEDKLGLRVLFYNVVA